MANNSNDNKVGTTILNTGVGFGATAGIYKGYTDPRFGNALVNGLNNAKTTIKNVANAYNPFTNGSSTISTAATTPTSAATTATTSAATATPQVATSARDVAGQTFDKANQAAANFKTATTEYHNALNNGASETIKTAEETFKQAAVDDAKSLAEYNKAIEQLASEGAPSVPEFTSDLPQTIETAEGTLGVETLEETVTPGLSQTTATVSNVTPTVTSTVTPTIQSFTAESYKMAPEAFDELVANGFTPGTAEFNQEVLRTGMGTPIQLASTVTPTVQTFTAESYNMLPEAFDELVANGFTPGTAEFNQEVLRTGMGTAVDLTKTATQEAAGTVTQELADAGSNTTGIVAGGGTGLLAALKAFKDNMIIGIKMTASKWAPVLAAALPYALIVAGGFILAGELVQVYCLGEDYASDATENEINISNLRADISFLKKLRNREDGDNRV